MTRKAYNELEGIKSELKDIISELDEIADGIKSDFYGIGQDKCSKSIDSVADKYRSVRRSLKKIDTGKIKKD